MTTIQCNDVQFQGIAAVLFDKDGTLAEAQDFLRNLGQRRSRLIDAQIPGVQEPLLMAFGLEGDQINPAGLLAVGTRYENEVAAAAYVAETGRDWIESLVLVRSAFAEADTVFKRKADNTPLVPGALEVLQALASSGIKLGILSSDTTENVRDFVERYQLGEFVPLQMGAIAGLSKPDPVLFQRACELLEVSVDKTLAIGDSTADLTMARVAGAAGCVGVTWGWTRAISLPQADVVLDRITDIRLV